MSAIDLGMFANDLYHQTSLTVGQPNFVISPICLQTALGMLYIASCGKTGEEMQKTLKLGSVSQEDFGKSYQPILESNLDASIAIANKIYLQTGKNIYTNYTNKVKQYFSSDVANINFADNAAAAKEISSWVAEKTQNKVQNFLDASSLSSSTQLVLVNTFSVTAFWRKPFVPDTTKPGDFYLNENDKVQVDMMSGSSYARFASLPELDAKAMALSCKEADINLLVVLPNKKGGLEDLENKLSTFNLQSFDSKLSDTMVRMKLPKFKIETFIDMAKTLKKMGMEQAFSTKADFGGLTSSGRLAISNVYHKAVVKIDEAGLEANAAASVVVLRTSTARSQSFNADHPFWFAVRKGETVLFAGRYQGPSE